MNTNNLKDILHTLYENLLLDNSDADKNAIEFLLQLKQSGYSNEEIISSLYKICEASGSGEMEANQERIRKLLERLKSLLDKVDIHV